jgi:hypothetical protein
MGSRQRFSHEDAFSEHVSWDGAGGMEWRIGWARGTNGRIGGMGEMGRRLSTSALTWEEGDRIL